MNPLIRQRLHVIFFVVSGIVVFAGLAFMALPVYTMAAYEKVEAVHVGTEHSEGSGSYRVVHSVSRQVYRFTPQGGKEKIVGVRAREPEKTITLYFHHNESSEVEFNVSSANWRSGKEVTVLLTIGVVLCILGVLGVIAGLVIRASNRPPTALPVSGA
jgi:hypothetical protein